MFVLQTLQALQKQRVHNIPDSQGYLWFDNSFFHNLRNWRCRWSNWNFHPTLSCRTWSTQLLSSYYLLLHLSTYTLFTPKQLLAHLCSWRAMSYIINLARNLGEELRLDDAIQSSGYGKWHFGGREGEGERESYAPLEGEALRFFCVTMTMT